MRIAAVCGSLHSASKNLLLLQDLAKHAPEGVEVTIVDSLCHLPHFDLDLDASTPPATVQRWRTELAQSDAVVIASPEYGHSLPGALKNGIDWVIGSGELNTKVVAITAAVPHPSRGKRGLQALKDTLLAVDAKLVWEETLVLDEEYETRTAMLLRSLIDQMTSGAIQDCCS